MSETIYISDNGNRRKATTDETAYILETQQELQTQLDAQEQAATVKATAKAALLNKLGITANEAELLIG